MNDSITTNTTELFTALDGTWTEFFNLVDSVDETLINVVPFENSWTVAQVATHVKKSNNAIIQGLQMQGEACNRNPEEGAGRLKNMFLDFTVKYDSPSFIIPDKKEYKKDTVIEQLKNSIKQLKQLRSNTNLIEIIDLPIFGKVTKLEILHFVLYHTQRHIHQLKEILLLLTAESVKNKI